MSKYTEIEQYITEGKTWDEMRELGITDTDRKKYYGYKDGLEEQTDEILAQEKQKIRMLKKELSIERQINNEQLKYITEISRIEEERKGVVEVDVNWFDTGRKNETPFYLVTTSDFHYNGDVEQLQRLNQVRNEITHFIDANDLRELILVELGDVIEGASLRTSQLMAIKSGMVKQTLEIAHAYKAMLEQIIADTDVELTYIGINSSNHTQLRNLGSKRNELPEEDLMHVFNDIVTTAKGVHRVIIGDEVSANINGYEFYFAHGHNVKNKDGHLEKISQRLNKLIDFGFFGHFHHKRDIDLHKRATKDRLYDMRAFYVPALANEESQYEKDRSLSSAPGIGVYGFDNIHGNVISKKVIIK